MNPENARPFIEAANPTHPSLIDTEHLTDRLFGFINVPMAVWIDEDGMIVRPAEGASIERSPLREMDIPEGLPERLERTFVEVKKMPDTADAYRAAILDWVENGSDSRFALSPDEVIARSQPRPVEHGLAAAHFELGTHYHHAGGNDAAAPWWREAHRLHPENWTYKRQAWSLATTPDGEPPDLLQGPTDLYEGNWLDDVIAAGGGEKYVVVPDLD